MKTSTKIAAVFVSLAALSLIAEAGPTWKKSANIPVVTEGATCNSTTDKMGITTTNIILSCQSGIWRQSGKDSLITASDYGLNPSTFPSALSAGGYAWTLMLVQSSMVYYGASGTTCYIAYSATTGALATGSGCGNDLAYSYPSIQSLCNAQHCKF